MSESVDEDEHSLEMHLPYIYKMLSKSAIHSPVHIIKLTSIRTFGSNSQDFPPLIPIMIGNTSPTTERNLGKLLSPYLSSPDTAFVISSDFAHWGSRFRYTFYKNPSTGATTNLRSSPKSGQPAIHESIKAVDFECMGACEGGSHEQWLETLEETGNTVCGRHPIGVIMAAVEEVRKSAGNEAAGAFKFVQYDRSSLVTRLSDSSVSYASAFAVI